MALGDCGTVLELLSAGDAPDRALDVAAQDLARSACLLRLELADRAAAVARRVVDRDSAGLEGYGALTAARAMVRLGRPDDALSVLADVALPGQAGDQVRLLRGRLLAPYGEAQGWADLRALHDTALGPEARYWEAEAHGVAGDVATMVGLLQEVRTDARPGGWDRRAEARLVELGVPVDDLAAPGARARAEARLAQLQKHRRTTDAEALADRLYGGDEPDTREAQMLLGHVYFAARAYPKALGAWRAALGPPEAATGSAQELFDYALCHARTDDYATAAVVYRRLIEAHPKDKLADFASFKLGYMRFDRGACDDAERLFAAHREQYPGSRHLDEALWFSARCRWRAEDYDGAVRLLRALREARSRSRLTPGAAYWEALAAGERGDDAAMQAGLEEVLERWPVSGYAWFAATRLGRRFPAKEAVFAPAYPEAWRQRPAVARSQALLRVGLRDFARDQLGTLPAPDSRAAGLALAWSRLAAGDYRGAQRLACTYAASPWRAGDVHAQQACTPRPEHAIVRAYAAPHGLDPNVAYGVMWAESALDPQVTSAVGARGLMQLMPEVGATLHAEQFPHRGYNADDLYLAPYNAALGTTELGLRHRSLQGALTPTSTPAVIASYNAGEEAVRGWLPEGGQAVAFDTWAEDVSYTETRNYVKGVLGYVMRYRWLYGDPAPAAPPAVTGGAADPDRR